LLPERVDSSDLVAGMSDLLDRTLGERIRVDVDLTPDTWPTYVDPHQLENAIVNLAVNARDAMDGTGMMRISTSNVTLKANEVGDVRPGEYVRISVTDTGCGMTPEVRRQRLHRTGPIGLVRAAVERLQVAAEPFDGALSFLRHHDRQRSKNDDCCGGAGLRRKSHVADELQAGCAGHRYLDR
jgi:hypothetical protein